MSDPMTFPERLDAASFGVEFGAVLMDLFGALAAARDKEEEDEK